MGEGKAPDTVGRYQITDRLASGGTSELFKGVFVGEFGFKKPIAIKRLLPHLAADPSAVEMFLDEARITSRLNHKNIIEVLELGSDAETQYMAMSFVDGIDLVELANECARMQIRLPPELAALIVREILDALDYIHNAKDPSGKPFAIVHRDVSPGNVMLSWNGDVKLVDFGRALGGERHHRAKRDSMRGKCGHISPEQVSGGTIDARSDLFQAGILLAELVMGRRVFDAARELDVLVMVRECKLDALNSHAAEFPIDLLSITLQALQRLPEKRWPSAAEFRDAIDEWLANTARVTRRELAALLARFANAPKKQGAMALGSGALPPLLEVEDDDDSATITMLGSTDAPMAMVEVETSRMDASQVLAYLAAEQAAQPQPRAATGSDLFDSRTFENRLEQSIRLAQGTPHPDEPLMLAAASAANVPAVQAVEPEPPEQTEQSIKRSRVPLVVFSVLATLGGAAAYFLL